MRAVRELLTRIELVLAVLLAVWLLGAYVLVPAVIRDAYAGVSLEFFNRMVSGQAQTPVEEYLRMWAGVAKWITLMLVTVGGGYYFAARQKNFTDRKAILTALYVMIGLGIIAHLYHVTAPMFDWHSPRQHDTAAIARNFYEEGLNIFYPRVDWRGASPGYVEAEFQIYTATVAALSHVFGFHEWIGRAVNTAIYALSALLLFQFARRLMNDRVALFAVLFYSLSPLAYFFTRSFQPDALLALASLAGVYYFWRWTDDGGGHWLALSCLGIAVAALIKPPSLYLGLVLLYLSYRKFGWHLFRQPVLWVFAAGAILPCFLWYRHALHLWETYGNTFGILGRSTIAGIWALNDPHWLLLGETLVWRLIFQISTPPGLLLLLVGILVRPNVRNQVLLAWAGAFALYILLVPEGHWGHNYYQLPIVFVVAIYMAHGAMVLLDKWRFKPAVMAGLAFCMLGLSIWQLSKTLRTRRGGFPRIAFGERVRELTKPTDLIVFAVPSILDVEKWEVAYRHRTPDGEFIWADPIDFYHSRRKGWSIDEKHMTPDFIEKLRAQGAAYFAIYSSHVLERHPGLKQALEEQHKPIKVTPRWHIYQLKRDSTSVAWPREARR